MNTIVCIKQVPDLETPLTGFKVDAAERRVIPPLGTVPVINPFDENVVEAAPTVKDTYGAKITSLTMVSPEAKDILRHAIAMWVDEGVLLEHPVENYRYPIIRYEKRQKELEYTIKPPEDLLKELKKVEESWLKQVGLEQYPKRAK